MDSLTHTVLGACMGEAIAGKKMGKKAMLLGALANNLPDIDVITGLWTAPAEGLLAHRGITHSILAAVFFSTMLAYVFHKKSRFKEMTYRNWLLLFAANIFTHIFIDAFTTYGTGWFEPFSSARVTFNTMFILDPFFLIPLLITCIVLLILKANSVYRARVFKTGLVIGVLYVLGTFINKIYVNGVVTKDLAEQNIKYNKYMFAPGPLNNFLWYFIASDDTSHYIGYYSVFDKARPISFQNVAKHAELADPYANDAEMKRLVQFSKDYYCITNVNDTLVFNDIRFGWFGGWEDKTANFVFRYNLCTDPSNNIKLERSRFNSVASEEIKKLFTRIKGKD